MRIWTEQQKDAIAARRGTVLVSAAAGSGKTSVLVERIIKRLTDPQNPTEADKLVVVTYTKAAAAEMKERIEGAVLAEIQRDPNNKTLKRQQMLIPTMNISTVHSFCSKLIREYFNLLNIAPDYKIAADKQREELMMEALSEVIEEELSSGNYLLADAFSSERDDKKLVKIILSLYEFTNSHLFPDKWLSESLDFYKEGAVEETPWGRVLLERLENVLVFSKKLIAHNLKLVLQDEQLAKKFTPMLNDDMGVIQQIELVLNKGNWNEIAAAIKGAKFARMPTVKNSQGDLLKSMVAKSRASIKEGIGDMTLLFWDNEEECAKAIEKTLPLVKALSKTTNNFKNRFSQKKREKNLVDYSDLEHLAIKLLLDDSEGLPQKSQIAKEISSRFDEIMIDEYQDTNEVQDWIFRAISKDDKNKFMVGDVKQCIYSFRQAMPHIFINYKDEFIPYERQEDAYPARVILDKNYRSRQEVINSVNFVFSCLMSRQVGGVDYTGQEALTVGASFENGEGYQTQLDFLEKPIEQDKDIAEINHIAGIIKNMVDSGFKVSGKNGLRSATYGDFCILLRSANKWAPVYVSQLKEWGIPAAASSSGGFFATREISGVLAFLQVIDNPNQDIPLLSVLLGPVYGFSTEDLAELRIKSPKASLYTALQGEEKFIQFLTDLEEYRLMAVHLPADRLVDYLYAKTGYMDLVLAMEKGESRLENLHRLRQYAGEFENAGYIGVSGFVRFTQRLKKNNSDLEAAVSQGESTDLVKVMSIHKSKGLEFPICIIGGCGRGTNNDANDIVLSSSLGMGLKLKDEEIGATYSNLIRDAILIKNKAETMSEELRVLYVAMTRAKEKLIMVATVNSIETTLLKLGACLTPGSAVDSYTVSTAKDMASWLMLCALKHKDGKALREKIGLNDTIVAQSNYSPWQINIIRQERAEKTPEKEQPKQAKADVELFDRLKKEIDFVYPKKELNLVPAKVTASALAEKAAGRAESLPRPSFLSSKGLNPAEKGIALHSFMQFANFSCAAENPQMECKRLVKGGFITAQQGAAVNFERVKTFFESQLGKRMVKAKTVLKEQRFACEIPGNLVSKEFSSTAKVVLQGAVDCAFVEGEKLYIVDFKTDRIDNPEKLAKAYGLQLRLYATALAQVKEIEIGGCSLYSLYLGKEIKIDMQETDKIAKE